MPQATTKPGTKVRNVWLVDMAFVVKAARAGQRFKLDYVAGRQFLERRLGAAVDACLFNSVDIGMGIPDGLRAFYHAMQQQRFEVRLQQMAGSVASGDHRQQRVDESLIGEFEKRAQLPLVGCVVLTSGDGHFVTAVQAARQTHGKRVILFAYDVNVSAQLKAAVDEFWPFEAYAAQLSRGAVRA